MLSKSLKNYVFVIVLSNFLSFSVLAKTSVSDQEVNQAAAQQTQQVLRDSLLRQQEALTTEQARKADQNVGITSLGDKAITEEIYGIAADLIPWLVENGGGEPEMMMKLLVAPRDSSGEAKKFYERIPAAQRAKIDEVSKKIQALRKSKATSKP